MVESYPYIPVYRLYKDSGGGVTELSLKYWKRIRKKIGKVITVICFKGKRYPPTFNTTVWDDRGNTVLLSGFSCGYGGTGPHGLLKFLQQEGFTDVDIRKIACQDLVIVKRTN